MHKETGPSAEVNWIRFIERSRLVGLFQASATPIHVR